MLISIESMFLFFRISNNGLNLKLKIESTVKRIICKRKKFQFGRSYLGLKGLISVL